MRYLSRAVYNAAMTRDLDSMGQNVRITRVIWRSNPFNRGHFVESSVAGRGVCGERGRGANGGGGGLVYILPRTEGLTCDSDEVIGATLDDTLHRTKRSWQT
jgi:hypothetical protein